MNRIFITILPLILISILFISLVPNTVLAAEVVIDGTASTAALNMKSKPQIVFVSDTNGYMFYKDSGGTIVYSKTTNGGTSWNAAVNTTAQADVLVFSIWYDQWTPGNSGSIIHIGYWDSGNDDLWYDTLNTATDVNGTEVAMDTTSGNSIAAADNLTITRGVDGDLYMAFCNGSLAAACNTKKCTGTCTAAINWTQAGAATPIDVANDYIRLFPLASNNILLVRDDVSANAVQSKLYTDATNTWAGAWTSIDASVTENATYPETVVGAVDKTTNDVYIAYGASVAGASTADIRTAVYTGGAWSLKTDVVTDVNTMIALDMAIDALSNDIYVGYLQGTAGSNTTAYYKKSLNNMTNWLTANTINTITGDIRYVYLDQNSNERIYSSYYRNTGTNDDIYGNTIVDLSALDFTWVTGAANFKVYESASLTWGAGTLACSGTLTDDNAATITCAGGRNIKSSTAYRVDMELKNAGGTTAKMNGAGDYVDNIAVKAGWAGTSPTLGNCAFYDVSTDDYTTTCNVAWNATNNVRITNTGSGNVNLQAGGNEGFMYLITTDSDVPSTNSTSYVNASIDSVTEDSSKITMTRQLISVTVSDGTVAYGIIPTNSSANTTSVGLNDTQTVTNNGNVNENFNIKGQSTSCWTLAGSVGNEQYKHDYCNTGSGSPDVCDATPTWTALTTLYQTIASGVAASGTSNFDLRLNMPSTTACYNQQSADLTIQAVEQ